MPSGISVDARLCDLFSRLLDCSQATHHAAQGGAPEIDGGALLLAVVLVVGVLTMRRRR